MDRLQTFGHVREIDIDARRVRVIAATGNVARDDAVIEVGGWVFDNYDRAPVVLWGHDDRQPPIARSIVSERIQTANELIELHEFDDDEAAENIWRKIQRGFVHAVSVRWLPLTWEWRRHDDGREYLHFTRQELLEVSYVSIPADPGAVVLRADGGRIDLSSYRPDPAPRPVEQHPNAERLHRFAAAIRETTAHVKGESK